MRRTAAPFFVFVRVLCLVSLSAGNAAAQEGDERGPVVTFRMVCLRHVPGGTDLYLAPDHVKGVSSHKDAGEGLEVKVAEGALTLPQNNLSPPMRARLVNGGLVFYTRPDSDGEGGGAGVDVAARAVFPAGTPAEVYVVFVPGPGTAEGGPAYQVAVIDSRKNVFPAGTHLLYNLTRSQVRGKLGPNGFGLNPGQRHLVGEVKTAHPRGYFEVMLEQRNPAGGEAADWERLARTQWKADATARRLCLLFDDPSRGRIAVRTFNEYLIALDAPEFPADPRPDDGLTRKAEAP